MNRSAEIVIIGAGAAGVMAAIWAGRTQPQRRIVLLDGAKKPGAKILVSGGGRCNVTHDVVTEAAYAGSSRNAIKKVLRRFDVPQTVQFFREIGVVLKREETGKLFPVTNCARTVWEALLEAVEQAGVSFEYPSRVEHIEQRDGGFVVRGAWGQIEAQRVVLATGGKSLPKTGSDGQGYTLARALGHSMTPRVLPALVPLTLPPDHFLCSLSGITVRAALEVRTSTGRKLISFEDSTLCTHFGLSGPSVLDISRYYLDATLDDPGVTLTINWLPGQNGEQVYNELAALGPAVLLTYLDCLPERLARALCAAVGIVPGATGHQLTRSQRRELALALTQLPLPITGSRGYQYAEVTAGGVPLSELHLDTMESRLCPGLYCCGELCDVDGRIGGYNFQWAWASGYVTGISI